MGSSPSRHEVNYKSVTTISRIPKKSLFATGLPLLRRKVAAKRAYAWSYHDGDQDKTVAVLGILPVDSPESAVKVAIAAKGRKL